MKILIFDTETGGLNPCWNDILQLSFQVIDGGTFQTLRRSNYYFPWPDDTSRIESGAVQVNGLTEEFLATQHLYERYEGLSHFIDELNECGLCVAHNGCFDKSFIDATARREGLPPIKWPPMIDTMKTTVNLCKLPSRRGGCGYKYPKLIELAECLRIRTDDINLHDSTADVELTKRCFIYLLKNRFYNI
ncbi:MAG: 3'-5' exonuclease [Bacteroidales bacterium]|nr:3'-5' exonuclease [Candidatus Colimorpha onthohippi]